MDCPPTLLASTPGVCLERRGLGTYLRISGAILEPPSVWSRYLAHPASREVFGQTHPLYARAPVVYNQRGEPAAIAYFDTRLLLAFFEVQLALGFAGASFQLHQRAIDAILAGGQAELETNYYEPFSHQDNVGIHYVYGPGEKGSGYGQADWSRFLQYSERAMRRAYELSPEVFGGTEEGLRRALAQYPGYLAKIQAQDGSVPVALARHWSSTVGHIMRTKGTSDPIRYRSGSEEGTTYIPFIDGILDMPYREGAVLVLQSICGSK